ncbi:MAG TPA: c-type cytochrome domain-containing protein, partial [Pirellulales bacterium]|nr:c-type cytochrome domain-containing protein [Pirellulales bacterium]
MSFIPPSRAADQTADPPVDYRQQIRPILRQRCIACHGALKQEAGLRLDTAELAIQGGDSGPAIVRGDVAASILVDRISASDAAERMPPEKEGAPLSAEQITLLRSWIAAGAAAPADEQPEADPKA